MCLYIIACVNKVLLKHNYVHFFHVISGTFCFTMVKLSSWNRDHELQRLKYFYLNLYRNNLISDL